MWSSFSSTSTSMTMTIQSSYLLTLKDQIEGHIKIFSSHAFFPHLKVSRRIKSHVLDRLVCFFFFLGWLAGWLGVQKDCQNLWQIGSESCDMKIRIVRLFEADTLPSHPSFSSSLPLFSALFFFHVRSDIQLDDSFKQNGQNQPTNNSRAVQVLYLLTYLLLCPQSFWQNRTGSDVCVCVCVLLCFWVCLITSVEECATWWLFFFLVFSLVFPQKTNHQWQPTHKVYYNTNLLPPIRKALGGFL